MKRSLKQRSGRVLIALLVSMGSLAGLGIVSASPASAHNPVTRTSPNGCTLSPDSSPVPVYYNFHDVCDRHDLCYDQLWFGRGWYNPFNGGWAGRLACDNMFHNEMRTWCGNQYWWSWQRRYTCYGVAATYYTAVRNFGGPFFDNPYLN